MLIGTVFAVPASETRIGLLEVSDYRLSFVFGLAQNRDGFARVNRVCRSGSPCLIRGVMGIHDRG